MKEQKNTCPGPDGVQLAFGRGLDRGLRDHMAECASCTREWEELTRLSQLGRQLPWSLPEESRRDEVRTSLLAAAAALGRTQKPPAAARRYLLFGIAPLLLGLLVGTRLLVPILLPAGTGPPTSHGTIHVVGPSEAGARYQHLGTHRDEIVRLSEGTLLIEVSPLSPGERFRVIAGDGEVEVRGTLFETTVSHEHLQGVRVLHGRVEVRPTSEGGAVLGPGENWQSQPPVPVHPEREREPTPKSEQRRGPVPAHAPHHGHGIHHDTLDTARTVLPVPPVLARPAHSVANSAERAFDDGWQALRSGHYQPAAAAFQRAAESAGGQSLQEDAWFWRAVAWARAGRTREAQEGLQKFLGRYPESPRAGEASSILGWMLYDAGALDEAERRFQAASRDRSSDVRDSARAGLADIAARRAAGTPGKGTLP